jgi:hypothetical protein
MMEALISLEYPNDNNHIQRCFKMNSIKETDSHNIFELLVVVRANKNMLLITNINTYSRLPNDAILDPTERTALKRKCVLLISILNFNESNIK